MKSKLRFTFSTGLILSTSFAGVLHATTAAPVLQSAANTMALSHFPEEIILAQAAGPDGNGEYGGGGEYGGDGEAPDGFDLSGGLVNATNANTSAIVSKLKEGAGLCGKTPEAYRIDCLSQTYREAAEKLASRGDYGAAKSVLLETADKLDALVKSNQDNTKPRIRVRTKSSGKKVQTRALTPVKPRNVAALKRKAIPILKEAETKLLRSASSSSKTSVHYQRIAAAVSSNKVLLRSS